MRTMAILRSTALAFAASSLPALAEPAIYESPEQAVEAFVAAVDASDRDAFLVVFGPESDDLIESDGPEEQAAARDEFMAAYQELAEIVDDEDGRKVLQIGLERWPFPVSMIQVEGGWRFDPDGAREEILDRRIGENELDVIAVLQRAVALQSDYRKTDWDGDGVMEFARSIISTPGQRDGLYLPEDMGEPLSPIGAFIAQASADGVAIDGVDQGSVPYLGYYFRVLTKQGPAAAGGAFDYLVADQMIGGHALLAYPADPGQTGVMSFMVAENGIVYEADLGADTVAIADTIDTFDPDEEWTPVTAE